MTALYDPVTLMGEKQGYRAATVVMVEREAVRGDGRKWR